MIGHELILVDEQDLPSFWGGILQRSDDFQSVRDLAIEIRQTDSYGLRSVNRLIFCLTFTCQKHLPH